MLHRRPIASKLRCRKIGSGSTSECYEVISADVKSSKASLHEVNLE